MSRLGLKSLVFHGDFYLGAVEVEVLAHNFQFPNNEIRISHISQSGERCPPLSILKTISPSTVRCKLKSDSFSAHEKSHLTTLHNACLQENKTAVVVLGGEEIHLVAIRNKPDLRYPCFWCCAVPIGFYGSCLGLLNLRCLSIVFDLDETLIVANTMKSFEDKIMFLQRRLECENDTVRSGGMSAELRRYVEDRELLRQYVERDNVEDNGRNYGVQFEVVPSPLNDQEKIVRPIVRIKEKNIVLTRINPEIRDTSVLVRLRPAWEDLRSYLNAKGRKRFEVYVCTMAERDYALEMWRLLDPEALLISSNQLSNRVVCVKSGSRKSLSSVFQNGTCHPRMAMVIDDRQKVWEDSDQPRVHVVPAFSPYYAPQAETANAVPVLCVARNVACNVRAGFFREFDENLIVKIFELSYEDEVEKLPYSPDVSDFLMSEDTLFGPNGNRDIPNSEAMNGNEVDRRLNRMDETQAMNLAPPNVPRIPDPVPPIVPRIPDLAPPNIPRIPDPAPPNVSRLPDLAPQAPHQSFSVSSNAVQTETSRIDLPLHKSALPESSFRPNIEVSESDPNKKRRFSVMLHGQDIQEYNSTVHFPVSRLSTNVSTQPIKSYGGCLVEVDSNMDQINSRVAGSAQENDTSQDKQQASQNHPCSKTDSSLSEISTDMSQFKSNEAHSRQEGIQKNHSQAKHSLTTGEVGSDQANREIGAEAGTVSPLPPFVYIGVLQEIGRRCGSKIEYRSVVSTSKDLQFSVEVLFGGDPIGVGMGKTKKDAQQQAAENALRTLSEEYKAYIGSHSGSLNRDEQNPSNKIENGFIWDDSGPDERPLEEAVHVNHTFEVGGVANGGLKSFGTKEAQPWANSPRTGENVQNKRPRGEAAPDLQIASSENHKNGNTVS